MNEETCFKIDSKELMVEQILVDYNDVPVYFICVDAEQNHYTVLCVDIDDEQYVVVKTTEKKLLELLMEKITMRELILSERNFWKVKAGNTLEEDICSQYDMDSMCLEDLPYENSYFKIATKEHCSFLDSIRYSLLSQEKEWITVDTGTELNPDELDVQFELNSIAVDDFVGILDVKVNNTVLLPAINYAKYTDIFSDMMVDSDVYRNSNLKNQTTPTNESDIIAA